MDGKAKRPIIPNGTEVLIVVDDDGNKCRGIIENSAYHHEYRIIYQIRFLPGEEYADSACFIPERDIEIAKPPQLLPEPEFDLYDLELAQLIIDGQ